MERRIATESRLKYFTRPGADVDIGPKIPSIDIPVFTPVQIQWMKGYIASKEKTPHPDRKETCEEVAQHVYWLSGMKCLVTELEQFSSIKLKAGM